jgi:hypothetical protein
MVDVSVRTQSVCERYVTAELRLEMLDNSFARIQGASVDQHQLIILWRPIAYHDAVATFGPIANWHKFDFKVHMTASYQKSGLIFVSLPRFTWNKEPRTAGRKTSAQEFF